MPRERFFAMLRCSPRHDDAARPFFFSEFAYYDAAFLFRRHLPAFHERRFALFRYCAAPCHVLFTRLLPLMLCLRAERAFFLPGLFDAAPADAIHTMPFDAAAMPPF